MTGIAGIGFQPEGQAVQIMDQETLYTTAQGHFGAVTRIDDYTLQLERVPAHLGTLSDSNFLGVTVYGKYTVPFKISRLREGVWFTFDQATLRLTVTGAKFPALDAGPPTGRYNIMYLGGTEYASLGLLIDETNVSHPSTVQVTDKIPMGSGGNSRFGITYDLVDMELRINARTDSGATFRNATKEFFGTLSLKGSGYKEIDTPTAAYDLELEYQTIDATNSASVYVSVLK